MNATADAPIFYRPREAARLLAVSPASVYRWIADGSLPAMRPPGAEILVIPAAAVEAFASKWAVVTGPIRAPRGARYTRRRGGRS